jgi:ferredoxin
MRVAHIGLVCALQVPRVDMDKCTQCNYCSLICPHAAVRPFLFTSQEVEAAPEGIKTGSRKAIGGGALDKYNFRIQVQRPTARLQIMSVFGEMVVLRTFR